MFRPILLLYMQGLWSIGRRQSRKEHLGVSRLWKHDQLRPHSHSLCDQAVASGARNDEHRLPIDYATEADYASEVIRHSIHIYTNNKILQTYLFFHRTMIQFHNRLKRREVDLDTEGGFGRARGRGRGRGRRRSCLGIVFVHTIVGNGDN